MNEELAFSWLKDFKLDGVAGQIGFAELLDFNTSEFARFAAEEIALLTSVVALGDELVERLEVTVARPVVAGEVDRIELSETLKSTVFDRSETIECEVETAECLESMNGCLFNEFDHVSGQVDTLDSSLETGRKRSQVVLAEIELLKADKVSEDVLLERLKINVRFLKRKI